MRGRAGAFVLALFACFARAATAQDDPFARIEVHVSAVSPASVYLDRGSEAGIASGDRVELFPLSRPSVFVIVRSVSKVSARADAPPIVAGIDVGIRGEALVPRERADRAKTRANGGDALTWSQPPENWSADMPLLAPATRAKEAELDTRVHGRYYAGADSVWDHGSNDRTYGLYRVGGEISIDDLLMPGDSFEFDGEANRHDVSVDDGDDDSSTRFRLERLSYTLGGRGTDPRRIQVGRFLQHEFPELGLLDGAEVTFRTQGGDRFGASAGFMPEPTAELSTGDDVQGALYYRYVSDEKEALTLGGALEKTWHRGDADRDLVLLDGSWRPSERLYLFTSAWIDYYTSSDEVKSQGFELTEAHLSGNYTFDGASGLGLFATHYRWPEIQRFEFEPVTDESLLDNKTSRVGINGWHDLSKTVRVDARVDFWTDQDESGNGGELGLTLLELPWEQSQIHAAVFDNEGEFSSVLGGRFDVLFFGERGSFRATYELTDAEQDAFNGAQSSLLQQAVRASWDRTFGDGWMLSLYAEDRFGDEQDSIAAGFFLQRNF